ncbi:nascent polypeptide-associated complex subunit alpha, muscle-specific form isoform X1 [Ixodes scapularis]
MSASRLEQMRAEFQDRLQVRSGLPRPTRTGIPTPTPAGRAAPAKSASTTSHMNGHGSARLQPSSVNGDSLCHNGSATKSDAFTGQAAKTASTPTSNGAPLCPRPGTANGSARPASASKLSARHVPPLAKGGVLMTMTTTQLRALADGHGNTCGASSGRENGRGQLSQTSVPNGRSFSQATAKLPTRSVAPTPTRSVTPASRKPPTPTLRNHSTPVPASKPPERSAKKQPVLPASTPKRPPVVANVARPASVSRTSAPPPASKPQTPKAPPPELRPLGPNQERCDVCSRGFDKDRIEKHRSICKKAAAKKVKVFDATKMRTKGTEAEAFVKRGLHNKAVPVKKSTWRAKHEEFLNAVRQARLVQMHLAAGGKLSDLPPPPPSENPDYVQCPSCGRKFNETAAERHIPRCKQTPAAPRARPSALGARK